MGNCDGGWIFDECTGLYWHWDICADYEVECGANASNSEDGADAWWMTCDEWEEAAEGCEE